MNDSKSVNASLPAWINTGALVAILSWLGIASSPEAELSSKVETEPSVEDQQLDNHVIYPSVTGATSLPASMWEDPFVHADLKKVKQLPTASDVMKTVRSKLDESGEDSKIMVLIVSTGGGSSEHDVERRRRRRHAVELALANLGFRMSFPDRMTYRHVAYDFHFAPRSSSKTIKSQIKVTLPTKLYKHSKDNSFILVTWLQDTHLGKRPFGTIQKVIGNLHQLKEDAAFCFLGPSTSNKLRSIVRDGKDYDAGGSHLAAKWLKDWKYGTALCNIVCTAPDETLKLKKGDQNCIKVNGQDPMRLIHTIAPDEQLLKILKRELEIRGVWPTAQNSNRVVLFAEDGSTSHIRSMVRQFKSEVAKPILIPYLKGIGGDGQGVSESGVEDYLTRSMDELSTLSTSRFVKPGEVRAVGIFGSRWQDKNLILSRAREIFPAATFFTTELDARYNSPEAMPHSQNLVVASHYGLWIDGSGTDFPPVNHLPSFRDGYQTSTFVGMSILGEAFLRNKLKLTDSKTFEFTSEQTTQNLFNLVGRSEPDIDEKRPISFLKPAIFEIGKHHAVQLSSFTEDGTERFPFKQPSGSISIHKHAWLVGILLAGATFLALSFNFLAAFSSDALELRRKIAFGIRTTTSTLFRFLGTNDRGTGQWRVVWPIAVSLGLGLTLVVRMLISDSTMESEPISFFDGISIWPSICGLYLVVVFGLSKIRNVFPHGKDGSRWGERDNDWVAFKLAGLVVISVYVISYLESSVIIPPARDLTARVIANVLLGLATFLVVFITCRCLLFSLATRQELSDRRSDIKVGTATSDLVHGCIDAMNSGISASRELLGPASLAILFIFARWRGWDAWGLDRTWLIFLCVPVLTCLVAALVVRQTAISYRDRAMEHLRGQRYDLLAGAKPSHATRERSHDDAESLKHGIDEISQLNRGPFGPISHDYLLGGFLLVMAMMVSGPFGHIFRQLITWLG